MPDGTEQAVAVHTKSARLARSTGTCPECGSGNYLTTARMVTKHGQVETKKCFDCGYPVVQQFSGLSAVTKGKAVGKTRQVAHGGTQVHNFAGSDTAAPAWAAEQGGPGR